MKKHSIFYLSICCCLLLGLGVAQSQSRSLPILETTPDVRSAGMGNLLSPSSQSNGLYTNPSSILFGERRFALDLATELTPAISDGGKDIFFQGNGSWHFLDRHAVHLGMRYIGGQAIPKISINGEELKKKTVTPIDMTIDLAYALRLTERISLFAQGSFIQSYLINVAYSTSFGVGAAYRQVFLGSEHPSELNCLLKVTDFGPPVNYGKNAIYALPTSTQLAADWQKELAYDHQLNVGLSWKYYFLPVEASLHLVAAGAEYSYKKLVQLRAGYEYGSRSISHATVGAGVQYKGVHLDLAYRHPTGPYALKGFLIGLGWSM